MARQVRATTESPAIRLLADVAGLASTELLRGTPAASLCVRSQEEVAAAAANAADVAPMAALTLVGLLIDAGRAGEARALLTAIEGRTEAAEPRAMAAYLAGRIAVANSDLRGALAHFRGALALDPRHIEACATLVSLLVASPSREGLTEARAAMDRIPEWTRRATPFLTFQEALWCEAAGDRHGALELAGFLLEGQLGPLLPAVEAFKERVVRPSR
jgi:thioredoxin-like negative regulator of GroEL